MSPLSGINHSMWRSSTPMMSSLYMYTDCLCYLPTLVDACKLYFPDRCVTYQSLLSMRKLSSCDYYKIMKCNFSAMINCMYNVYMYSTIMDMYCCTSAAKFVRMHSPTVDYIGVSRFHIYMYLSSIQCIITQFLCRGFALQCSSYIIVMVQNFMHSMKTTKLKLEPTV